MSGHEFNACCSGGTLCQRGGSTREENPMGLMRLAGGLVLAVLLLPVGAQTPPAQAPSDAPRPHKSVYGKLEGVDTSRNGVIMRSDAGERLAWQFKPEVVAEVATFKPGDPMIVIYRQISPNDKRVTAVAFPGAASSALYVNMTGERVLLRSAPAVDGVCGRPDAGPVSESMIPAGGRGEGLGACWCCASAGQSCAPSSKTGQGKALLVSCFE